MRTLAALATILSAVLPRVSTAAMSRFLADFAVTLSEDTHAVLVLDQAGWHGAKGLQVPESITLVPLPPYSPDLNPVERVRLFLRERYLSHRLLADYEAVVDACCSAWNTLTAEAGRLRSLTAYPTSNRSKLKRGGITSTVAKFSLTNRGHFLS